MSIQEGTAEVDDFIEKYGLTYPFLMDESGQVAISYEIASTPTTYFIAPDGTITDSLAGVVSQEWIESNLKEFVGL